MPWGKWEVAFAVPFLAAEAWVALMQLTAGNEPQQVFILLSCALFEFPLHGCTVVSARHCGTDAVGSSLYVVWVNPEYNMGVHCKRAIPSSRYM
jgi:hypothetical protein